MAFLVGANTIINNNVSILHTTFETVSGNTQNTQVKVTASDGAAQDLFGDSVAVGSGRIVVGASSDDAPSANTGSAYIFDLNGTQLAKITASDGDPQDEFGTSVSVGSGRIVVGAPLDDAPSAFSGSAYIFDLNGTELAKITASDGASNDRFGESVSVGSGRIVVGAFGDDDGASGSGSAYIFDLNGTQLAKITASDGAINDRFGTSVSVGSGRIVVGANEDDDLGSNAGSAYIFDLSGNQLAKIKASDGAASDFFGDSVAVGSGCIVVGAPFDSGSGSAYIFDLNGTQLAKITASDGASPDRFGTSVSVGSGRIVVGAHLDVTILQTGSAYIFDLDGTELAKITASDGAADDSFGFRVAVGSGRIVVGAYLDDDHGTDSGSAYIYKLPETMDIHFETIIDTYRY
jgi:hypothetical protein